MHPVVTLKPEQTKTPPRARYDGMCRAVAAHAVDEVKDIRDQAIALETHARQAHNVEAELPDDIHTLAPRVAAWLQKIGKLKETS
jgi:hypothetical protein